MLPSSSNRTDPSGIFVSNMDVEGFPLSATFKTRVLFYYFSIPEISKALFLMAFRKAVKAELFQRAFNLEL